MKIEKSIRIKFFILFSIALISGCSSKNNNIDFDLSNLPKPKNTNLDSKEKKEVINEAKQILDVKDVIASILLVDDLRIQKN